MNELQRTETSDPIEPLSALVPDYDKFSDLVESSAFWSALLSANPRTIVSIVTLLALAAVGFNAETVAKVTIAVIMVAFGLAAPFIGRSKNATNTETRAHSPAQSGNARGNPAQT